MSLPRVHACHVDAGLVATYSGPRSDTVTVHLRRFGYPPELVGLRLDDETNRGTLGDKRVSITDTTVRLSSNAAAIGPLLHSLAARNVSIDHIGTRPRTRLTRRADRSSDRNGRPKRRPEAACRDSVDDRSGDSIERHHGVAESGVHHRSGHPPDHA